MTMADLETIKGKVLIDAERYEELIKTEAKVETVVNYIQSEDYISVGKLMAMFGFHIPKEKEKKYEEVMELDS